MNTNSKNRKLCDDCTICCEHIALEIDTPETKEDFHHLIWYLLHKNIVVFVDNEDSWILEFKTPCKALNKGLCEVYEDRPDICKEYDQDSCEKFGSGDHYKQIFTERKQLINWIKENTKITNLF